MVPGERRGDGADLLVAGHGQERRGPAVALHPDQEHPRLGLGQLGGAVRVDRAAGVHVRVDQRGQRARGLQHRVQVEAHLGQQRQVRPEPGHRDDLVDRVEPSPVHRHQHQPAVRLPGRPRRCGTRSPCEMCPASTAAAARCPSAPRAGSWSASPPPKVLPTCPRRSSHATCVPGHLLGELGERDQRGQRRVPARRRPRRACPRSGPRTAGSVRSGTRRRSGRPRPARPGPAGRRRRAGSASSRCRRRRPPRAR